MTREIQIYAKSEFSRWLHDYGPSADEIGDAVDIEDIDYVLFSYLTGDIMTLEVKEKNGRPRRAQNDTHNILRQLLILGSQGTIETLRGIRPIHYRGHHLVQLSNSTPDNGSVRVDGRLLTRRSFLEFCNFGRPLKRR